MPRLTVSQLDVVEPQLPTSIRDDRDSKLVVGPPIFDADAIVATLVPRRGEDSNGPHRTCICQSSRRPASVGSMITVDGNPHKRVNVGDDGTTRRGQPARRGRRFDRPALARAVHRHGNGRSRRRGRMCRLRHLQRVRVLPPGQRHRGERENLYGDPQHAAAIAALRTLLDTALRSPPRRPGRSRWRRASTPKPKHSSATSATSTEKETRKRVALFRLQFSRG